MKHDKSYYSTYTIYTEHTDVTGVVYHGNYFSFCDMSLAKVLAETDLNPHRDYPAKVNCSFLSPALLGDVVVVKTDIASADQDSVTVGHVITNKDSGNILFKATHTIKIS